MNERKLFDNGFFQGVRDAKNFKADPAPNMFPTDPFDVGYLLGVVYFGEKKEIESSDPAWAEVA